MAAASAGSNLGSRPPSGSGPGTSSGPGGGGYGGQGAPPTGSTVAAAGGAGAGSGFGRLSDVVNPVAYSGASTSNEPGGAGGGGAYGGGIPRPPSAVVFGRPSPPPPPPSGPSIAEVEGASRLVAAAAVQLQVGGWCGKFQGWRYRCRLVRGCHGQEVQGCGTAGWGGARAGREAQWPCWQQNGMSGFLLTSLAGSACHPHCLASLSLPPVSAECSRMCLPRGRCTLPNPLLLLLPSQLSAFERTYQGAAAREMDSLLDVQKQLSERRAALQAVVGGGEGVGEGGGRLRYVEGGGLPRGPGGR